MHKHYRDILASYLKRIRPNEILAILKIFTLNYINGVDESGVLADKDDLVSVLYWELFSATDTYRSVPVIGILLELEGVVREWVVDYNMEPTTYTVRDDMPQQIWVVRHSYNLDFISLVYMASHSIIRPEKVEHNAIKCEDTSVVSTIYFKKPTAGTVEISNRGMVM